jgi:RimJ/RimL family protein N-acetyltransferase
LLESANDQIFETERLVFRCATMEDLKLYERIFCDPEMMRFLGGPLTQGEILPLVQKRIEDWLNHGYGKGVVFNKQDMSYIGTAGISASRLSSEDELEIGWMILPEKQHNGFATELTKALVDYAFNKLKTPRVVAGTHPANVYANKILTRLRFACTGESCVSIATFPSIDRLLVWELLPEV